MIVTILTRKPDGEMIRVELEGKPRMLGSKEDIGKLLLDTEIRANQDGHVRMYIDVDEGDMEPEV